MQILSYPIGLLIGLFPIAVDLGETRAPAHVLLDGRPVCEATMRSPGCMVDLGPDPRVHLLELVRTDAAGHVTERAGRWINRPGIEPEVLVAGGCDEKRRDCDFDLTWAHPGKLDPKRLVLQLDGTKVWEGKGHRAHVALGQGAKPQVVVADAEFPDGTRASYTRTLYAFYPEEAQASLLAVPIVLEGGAASGEDAAAVLKAAGLPVRAVEETEPEVTFVIAPRAFDALPGVMPERPSMPGAFVIPIHSPAAGSAFGDVHVIFPDESLIAQDARADKLGTLHPVTRSRFSRYADAVAAAGYALGAKPRRRAVVLVLSGFDRLNISCFSAAQARAYLAEAMVPLVVWRVGDVSAPEWPDGARLMTRDDVQIALRELRGEIDRQRIVWLEGLQDSRYLGHWLAPGVALAGRDAPRVRSDSVAAQSGGNSVAPRLRSIGPDGGPVHALATAAGGSVVYAGTHAGVFRSRDSGTRWEPASAGLPGSPVRCLALAAEPAVVYAGTDSGFFRSTDAGAHWERGVGALATERITTIALDPASPRVLYAGSEGRGVLRSDDGGATLLASSMDHGDVRALAVDPRDHTVFAASESGVFRSRDRGMTWVAAAKLPARALALELDAGGAGRIFAATAGEGIFVSGDGGASWSKTGLRRAYVTSLGLDPGSPGRLVAGSPDGIFVSADGGANWRLARVDAVEALAFGSPPVLLAGGVRGVLRRGDPAQGWRDSDEGLAAQIVYSVAAPLRPPGALYAGTSTGLLRSTPEQTAWTPVAGVPDGLAAYAVGLRGSDSPEILLGTSGSVGRSSDHGDSWTWSPTHGAFSLSIDPSRPDVALAATREGVYRSEDGGAGWSPATSGLEKTFALQLGEDPKDPSVVYAATAGAGVFRSGDGARSWKAGGRELTRRIVRCVAVDPGAGEAVYAGTDSGVFRSSNGGGEWSPIGDGLPQAPVYALVADARAPGTIFAGTAQGLFRTADGGRSWAAFPPEGIGAAVTSLWLDSPREALVAGSLGAGVFVIPLGAGDSALTGLH